jgi:hypothetical protein
MSSWREQGHLTFVCCEKKNFSNFFPLDWQSKIRTRIRTDKIIMRVMTFEQLIAAQVVE